MTPEYSFVIPVYNRPDEIFELLDSMTRLKGNIPFEVVVVEDGSSKDSALVVREFQDRLSISYYFKENTGPGDSRNYGMQKARGDYFLILDSDCLLPEHYLVAVNTAMQENYTDVFGGPDAAHPAFTALQKAINYAMTSWLTTGGIRGKKGAVTSFEPRSFNMGISRKAFERSGGFGRIHPGEDPDLSIRLLKAGFKSRLVPEAFVYHKRRISWDKFRMQVYKFGLARPVLNHWHPQTAKLVYWFPSLFMLGAVMSVVLLLLGWPQFLLLYLAYFILIFMDALRSTGSLEVALLSIPAVCIQFFGYGRGFLRSVYLVRFKGLDPEQALPELFFK